jgi:hypothetical protein
MSPLKYELGFYIQDDGILHSPRLENLKFYLVLLLFKLHCVLLSEQ